jgi:hypothetical protein
VTNQLSGVPCTFCGDSNEQDVDYPPSYEHGSKTVDLSPKIIQTIEEKVDELDDELRELSLKIHGTPARLYLIEECQR